MSTNQLSSMYRRWNITFILHCITSSAFYLLHHWCEIVLISSCLIKCVGCYMCHIKNWSKQKMNGSMRSVQREEKIRNIDVADMHKKDKSRKTENVFSTKCIKTKKKTIIIEKILQRWKNTALSWQQRRETYNTRKDESNYSIKIWRRNDTGQVEEIQSSRTKCEWNCDTDSISGLIRLPKW